MTKAGRTKRQNELLTFIDGFQKEKGFTPSYVEMKQALGLSSSSGIHRIVGGLEERGYLVRRPGKARSIKLAVHP